MNLIKSFWLNRLFIYFFTEEENWVVLGFSCTKEIWLRRARNVYMFCMFLSERECSGIQCVWYVLLFSFICGLIVLLSTFFYLVKFSLFLILKREGQTQNGYEIQRAMGGMNNLQSLVFNSPKSLYMPLMCNPLYCFLPVVMVSWEFHLLCDIFRLFGFCLEGGTSLSYREI